jgi:8-oxo-dGTP diphosphatase
MEPLKSLRPSVGVGVLVIKYKKVLLGKRKGENGDGTWCPPGGHLEFREEIFDCARRETLEEAGIRINTLRMGPVTNDNSPSQAKHYVTLFVVADYDSGNPAIMEPDKCSEWRWCSWDNLPQPLFPPLQNFVDAGFSPFDY